MINSSDIKKKKLWKNYETINEILEKFGEIIKDFWVGFQKKKKKKKKNVNVKTAEKILREF